MVAAPHRRRAQAWAASTLVSIGTSRARRSRRTTATGRPRARGPRRAWRPGVRPAAVLGHDQGRCRGGRSAPARCRACRGRGRAAACGAAAAAARADRRSGSGTRRRRRRRRAAPGVRSSAARVPRAEYVAIAATAAGTPRPRSATQRQRSPGPLAPARALEPQERRRPEARRTPAPRSPRCAAANGWVASTTAVTPCSAQPVGERGAAAEAADATRRRPAGAAGDAAGERGHDRDPVWLVQRGGELARLGGASKDQDHARDPMVSKAMRRLLVIGIGAGDPEHVTAQGRSGRSTRSTCSSSIDKGPGARPTSSRCAGRSASASSRIPPTGSSRCPTRRAIAAATGLRRGGRRLARAAGRRLGAALLRDELGEDGVAAPSWCGATRRCMTARSTSSTHPGARRGGLRARGDRRDQQRPRADRAPPDRPEPRGRRGPDHHGAPAGAHG